MTYSAFSYQTFSMKRGPYKKDRKELYLKARELRQEGYGYRTIAHRLGNQISYNVIKNWVVDITSDMRRAHKLSTPLFTRHKIKLEECRTNYSRRNWLIRKHGHKCQVCFLSEWLDRKIPLELDHIDGNKKNNSEDNLRLLCPNCHAFTETYKGKNVKRK